MKRWLSKECILCLCFALLLTIVPAGLSVQAAGIPPRIDAGNFHASAVLADGNVWSWGRGYYGNLGNGHTADSNVPVRALDFENVQDVAVGASYTIALKEDGSVWSWGYNYHGRLGHGDAGEENYRTKPHRINGLENIEIAAIAAGDGHALALDKTGQVWAWGDGTKGQLGDGKETSVYYPAQVPLNERAVAIAAGTSTSLAVLEDGSLWGWGDNWHGFLRTGDKSKESKPVKVIEFSDVGDQVKAVDAGADFVVVQTVSGAVYSWGENEYGQLGNGDKTYTNEPQKIGIDNVSEFAVGRSHVVALTKDGEVWTWGQNNDGQLGLGHNADQSTPQKVESLADQTIVSIGAGHLTSYAITEDGTFYAWGDNTFGILGIGDHSLNQNTPVQVKFPGTSADLKKLRVTVLNAVNPGGGFLEKEFDKDTLFYTLNAPYRATKLELDIETDDELASFIVKVGNDSVDSGSSSGLVTVDSLKLGDNIIQIEVTSGDKKTTKTYEIQVTRAAASTNANLKSLRVSSTDFTWAYDLLPAVEPGEEKYTVNVPYSVEAIQLKIETDDLYASYVVKRGEEQIHSGPSSKWEESIAVGSLVVGSNIITIEVTAEDEATTKTYQITVNRATISTNADLEYLIIDLPGMLLPLDPDQTSHTVELDELITELTVTAAVYAQGASFTINGIPPSPNSITVPLDPGSNQLELVVTAEDGTTKTYMLNIINPDPVLMKVVIAELNSLPNADKVNLADQEAIESARAKYDSLTDKQKQAVDVTLLDRLIAAETALQELLAAADDNHDGNGSGDHNDGNNGSGSPDDSEGSSGSGGSSSSDDSSDSESSDSQDTSSEGGASEEESEKTSGSINAAETTGQILIPEESMRISPLPSGEHQQGIQIDLDEQVIREIMEQLDQDEGLANTLVIQIEEQAEQIQTNLERSMLEFVSEMNPDVSIQITTPLGTVHLPVVELSDLLRDRAEARVEISLGVVPDDNQVAYQHALAETGVVDSLIPITTLAVQLRTEDGQQVAASGLANRMELVVELPETLASGEAGDPQFSKYLVGVAIDPVSHQLYPVSTRFARTEQGIAATMRLEGNVVFTIVENRVSFVDIPSSDPAKEIIESLAAKLIVRGVTEDLFEPNRAMTRAELTEMIIRALGYSPSQTLENNSFKDLDETDGYTPYILTAKQLGLVEGYGDGTFRPEQVLTLPEQAVMLARALNLYHQEVGLSPREAETSFNLASLEANLVIPNWAEEAVQQLLAENILEADKLADSGIVNRREGSMAIYELMKKLQLID